MELFLWVALSSFTSLAFGQTTGPVVTTSYGPVEGFNYNTSSGFQTQVFLGIPYAAPPVGNLRFEKTQPPPSWTTTRSTKAFGAPCVSLPKYSAATASEDCLFLNIVRPKAAAPNNKGYPVVVWIHGGGNLLGSAEYYNYPPVSQNIVEKGKVIFVSFNYRIAAFGFYSAGENSEAPGNYALWDQIQALKFVQNNIKKFGGDPKKITVMGQSSGATSVSWLALSPVTKNLFDQAIMISGGAVSSAGRMDITVENSRNLTDILGCSCAINTKACLKAKTTAEIQAGMGQLIPYIVEGDTIPYGSFKVAIDGEIVTTGDVEKLAKKAPKREIFMGSNSQEFVAFTIASSSGTTDPSAQYFPITLAKAANYTKTDFEDIVRIFLATPEVFGNRSAQAAQDIINFYETQSYPTAANLYLQLYAQIFSDLVFNIPMLREAKIRAQSGSNVNVYLYDFVPPYYANANFQGAGHTSDQYNLWGVPAVPLVGDAATVQAVYTDLMLSFMNTGTPSTGNLHLPSNGIRSSLPKIKYVLIKPNPEIKADLWSDRLRFWNKLAQDYGFDWIEGNKV